MNAKLLSAASRLRAPNYCIVS